MAKKGNAWVKPVGPSRTGSVQSANLEKETFAASEARMTASDRLHPFNKQLFSATESGNAV